MAIVYSFVWPHSAATADSGFRYFIVRWGHALTWILLALNFFLRGINPELNGIANMIAMAGGVSYLLFMIVSFVVK
ncbi:MAG: hypothetical protein QM730_08115 [Anaerolineales bacterium]